MDTQAINSTKSLIALKPNTNISSKPSAEDSKASSNTDIVNLSQDARDKVSSSKKISTVIGDRKLSVTDNNDVVLEVIDPQTQKVVRTIPSEEQLDLKAAIRKEIDKV